MLINHFPSLEQTSRVFQSVFKPLVPTVTAGWEMYQTSADTKPSAGSIKVATSAAVAA